MTTEGVEVRQSRTQGKGLYASKAFAPGEVVLRWDLSKTISREQLASLSPDELRYTHPLDNERVLIVQPPERFVNHSCNNNTEVRDFCDVAIVPIECGDEITSDYGSDGSAVSFECQCGCTNCRGVIG
jgi:SET domain-containing protein